MNKKIPVWFYLLTCFSLLIFSVMFGWGVQRSLLSKKLPGKIGSISLLIASFPDLIEEVFLELSTSTPLVIKTPFPDIDGFQKDGKLPKGVAEDNGYLLLPSYDHIKKQATVRLIRIHNQQVVHEWVPDIESLKEISKNTDSPFFDKNNLTKARYQIAHPFLSKDGGIIFRSGKAGPLYKINVLSQIEWVVDGIFHHSIEQDADGNIWVPSVIEPSSFKRKKLPHFKDDAITEISPDGKILCQKSVATILEENGYRGLLIGAGQYERDPIHLNDIQPAFYSTQYWEKGDLLLSMRHRSTVCLYRPRLNKIIWLRTGPWLNQHDVDFVGTSRVSVFGNDVVRIKRDITVDPPIKQQVIFYDKHNEIYVYEFSDGRISTPFSDILRKAKVRTRTQGLCEFIEDGDVFVEETNRARLLRLSADKVKWEYTNNVDERHISRIKWTRYLTSDVVAPVLPILKRYGTP